MRALIVAFCAFNLLIINKVNAESCIFCETEIVENQFVFESKHYNVVPNLEPRVEGHLLVIPKRNLSKARQLGKEEWEELAIIIPKAVKFFFESLNADQFIIFEKNGPTAFQPIPHLHFHLFPVTSQTWSEIFDIVPEILAEKGKRKLPYTLRIFSS